MGPTTMPTTKVSLHCGAACMLVIVWGRIAGRRALISASQPAANVSRAQKPAPRKRRPHLPVATIDTAAELKDAAHGLALALSAKPIPPPKASSTSGTASTACIRKALGISSNEHDDVWLGIRVRPSPLAPSID